MPDKVEELETTCALTGSRGSFVRCHLIPQALTRPPNRSAAMIEVGEGNRPKRSRSGWHDSALVTAEGETILSRYDTWGIRDLRKHRLVWSGWGASKRGVKPEPGRRHDVRIVELPDARPLRLFFLSLLWRGAATDRPEFSHVEVRPDDLRELQRRLIAGDPGDPRFFPVVLTQLSTRADHHNRNPSLEAFPVTDEHGRKIKEIQVIRYYFDGLIAHFHLDHSEQNLAALGEAVLGATENLGVITIEYEGSYQHKHAEAVAADAKRQWPDQITSFETHSEEQKNLETFLRWIEAQKST